MAVKTKDLLAAVEKSQFKEGREFAIGDSVDVHVRIVEGDKERIQIFSGIVIARRGHGVNASFTVRRLVGNEGVERVFPVHSPSLEKVAVKKHGKIRRAKLYFLRDRLGKATRLAEKRGLGEVLKKEEAPADVAVKPRQQTAKPEPKPEEGKAEAKAAAKKD